MKVVAVILGLYNDAKAFVKSLLDEKGAASSKRFISTLGFLVICYAFLYAAHTGKKLDDHEFDAMCIVVTGAAGMGVYEKLRKQSIAAKVTDNENEPKDGKGDAA